MADNRRNPWAMAAASAPSSDAPCMVAESDADSSSDSPVWGGTGRPASASVPSVEVSSPVAAPAVGASSPVAVPAAGAVAGGRGSSSPVAVPAAGAVAGGRGSSPIPPAAVARSRSPRRSSPMTVASPVVAVAPPVAAVAPPVAAVAPPMPLLASSSPVAVAAAVAAPGSAGLVLLYYYKIITL